MIIAALLTSLTIAREWEMGTMEQLLSTPLRPAEMVLGKMLAFFVVGLADSPSRSLVGVFVFRVPLRGSVPLLVVSTCLFLLGSLFWGILISAAARTQLLAYQMGMLSSFLPAFLLSGFVYSIENMPQVIQVITRVVPARYFVTILKGVFLKGVGSERAVGRAGVPGAVRRHRLSAGDAETEPEGGVNYVGTDSSHPRKEFRQALREPRMRMLLFLPPLVQFIIFGYAVNLDVDHARIAWMDMDRTPESRDLRGRFEGSGRFDVVAMPAQRRRGAARAGPRPGAGRGAGAAGVRARHGARPRRRGAGAGGRHQLQHGVADCELRAGRSSPRIRPAHGAPAEPAGADAESRRGGERVGAAGDGAQPRVVQPRPAQPQLLRAGRGGQHHHAGDPDADRHWPSCGKKRSAPWSS